MSFEYNDEHLEAFQTMAKAGDWAPTLLHDWSKTAKLAPLTASFASQSMTRELLKWSSSSETVSDRDLLWGILAWGRMRFGAVARFKNFESSWIRVTHDLRFGGLTRQESYALCAQTAANAPSGGIGPAYFTKLIFFANPRHDGYIMDQWTSRSVNLLVSNGPVVRMRTKDHVHPKNDSSNYENFCGVVEDLSRLIGRTPEETEQCLFSTGWKGKQIPAKWRRYVMEKG